MLKECVTWLKMLQKLGEPIWWVKQHGSQYSKAGVPDLHITYRSCCFWVELKSATGKPTDLQLHMLKQIENAGGYVGVVRSVEDLKNLMRVVFAPGAAPWDLDGHPCQRSPNRVRTGKRKNA